jgi:hypothetical protein
MQQRVPAVVSLTESAAAIIFAVIFVIVLVVAFSFVYRSKSIKKSGS